MNITDFIIGILGILSLIFMLLVLQINLTSFFLIIILSFLSLYAIYTLFIKLGHKAPRNFYTYFNNNITGKNVYSNILEIFNTSISSIISTSNYTHEVSLNKPTEFVKSQGIISIVNP